MGILPETAAMVMGIPLPAGFSVCELGDQMMSGGKAPTLAEPFYRGRGCGRYVALDGNGRGTFTVDLNDPLPALPLGGPFDLVTDFGTGEHIFDQAQVWRTLHALVAPGGLIAIDRPTQGYAAHCFYTITTGLIEDVADANGYDVRHLATVPTPRGALVRAVLQAPMVTRPFVVPQQGRYQDSLRFPKGAA